MKVRERRALRKGPTVERPKVNNADNDDDIEMDVSVNEEAIENTPFTNGTIVKDSVTQSNARIQSTETITVAPATAPTMPQVLLNSGKSVCFTFQDMLNDNDSTR
jgi:hypothetical protein